MRKKTKRFNKKLLFDILNIDSPTYYEQGLGDWYISILEGSVDHVGRDVLGNVSASIVGANYGSRVMISAHHDEVGVVVTGHTEEGYLKITDVGYIDPVCVPGSLFRFTTPGGEKVLGVALKTPVHLLLDEEEGKGVYAVPEVSCMVVDVGATSLSKARLLVPEGSFGVWNTSVVEAPSGSKLFARGADNKLSVYVVTRVMQELALSKENLPAKVFGVLTASEEDTGSAAVCAAYKIDPAINIVLDVTALGPFEGEPAEEGHTFDKIVIARGPLIHDKLSSFVIDTAAEMGLNYRTEFVSDGTGTDLESLRTVKGGSACCLISIPVRMLHTPLSLFDPSVLEDVVSLVVKVVQRLDFLKL